jgi:hypothetical protein
MGGIPDDRRLRLMPEGARDRLAEGSASGGLLEEGKEVSVLAGGTMNCSGLGEGR